MSEELRVLITKVLMKIRTNSCSRQGRPQRWPKRGGGGEGRTQPRQAADECSCELWGCTQRAGIQHEREETSGVHLSLYRGMCVPGIRPVNATMRRDDSRGWGMS